MCAGPNRILLMSTDNMLAHTTDMDEMYTNVMYKPGANNQSYQVRCLSTCGSGKVFSWCLFVAVPHKAHHKCSPSCCSSTQLANATMIK